MVRNFASLQVHSKFRQRARSVADRWIVLCVWSQRQWYSTCFE